jgi:hypothetical protein
MRYTIYTMKYLNKSYLTILIISCCAFLFWGCPKNEPCATCPPDGQSTVKLSLEYKECKEVWLKLDFTDLQQPREYALFRDSSQILKGIMVMTDTVLIDTNVLAGHQYTYTSQRFKNLNTYGTSTPLIVRTLDSTSHNIQWQVDTLGAWGVIRDVWVFDRNNAWAVGEIYLKDSNGQIEMGKLYNAARWDGNRWELKRIAVDFRGNTIIPPLDGIICFSQTQIWMIGSLPILGDGTNWTIYDLRMTLDPNISISKAWGLSPTNLIFISRGGGIVQYNSGNWSKMISNTTVDLQDIYGLDASHIWATGTNSDHNGTVILSFNGSQWHNLYEGNQYGFSSVWIQGGERLNIAGDSGPWKFDLRSKSFIKITSPAQYVMFCVRGSDANDVFFTGQNSEITHYNGSTYKLYTEVQNLIQADTWWNSIKVKQDFILAGGGYDMGYNFAPIVLRGYR